MCTFPKTQWRLAVACLEEISCQSLKFRRNDCSSRAGFQCHRGHTDLLIARVLLVDHAMGKCDFLRQAVLLLRKNSERLVCGCFVSWISVIRNQTDSMFHAAVS
uniref:Uncharacterized protein n=1 Tax=Paramoeba aestuarina TaxID=180227 RepID=A0A7S4PAU1_9EUKA|mmetsp:Transcript_39213/g.62056  ORF Transcript_39213/g.62056 Transcript_39213/m.62056 type:complete len:104 (+) Transcript_39213:286-597(+)